ncbi:MAG: hypothetical protein Q4D38_13425 [Planctomycetia bacterium]|nr:hypothetical protein [Planctomycetia bacterium]
MDQMSAAGKIVIALITPRAGEWNYRYIIPSGVAWTDRLVAEKKALLEHSPCGLLLQTRARQLGGRVGEESLLFYYENFPRLSQRAQALCRKTVQRWFDEEREALVERIDWSQEGRHMVVPRSELAGLYRELNRILQANPPAPPAAARPVEAREKSPFPTVLASGLAMLLCVAVIIFVWRSERETDVPRRTSVVQEVASALSPEEPPVATAPLPSVPSLGVQVEDSNAPETLPKDVEEKPEPILDNIEGDAIPQHDKRWEILRGVEPEMFVVMVGHLVKMLEEKDNVRNSHQWGDVMMAGLNELSDEIKRMAEGHGEGDFMRWKQRHQNGKFYNGDEKYSDVVLAEELLHFLKGLVEKRPEERREGKTLLELKEILQNESPRSPRSVKFFFEDLKRI